MTPRQRLREVGACERAGDWEGAARRLQDAIAATRETPQLANRLGDLWARADRSQEAVAAWSRAVALYEGEGFLPKALAVARKMVRHAPDDPEVGLRLADLHAALGHGVEAAEAYRTVVVHWLTRGRREEAIRALERRAAVASDTEARTLLGRLYAEVGRRMLAIGQFLALAEELGKAGAGDEALEVLRAARHAVPDSGRIRTALADGLARRGRAAEAVALLEGSPEPLSPAARIVLADALVAEGRGEEALQGLQQWEQEHPDDREVGAALARTRAALGQADAAPLPAPSLPTAPGSDATQDVERLLDEAAREIGSATALVIATGAELDAELGGTNWLDEESLWRAFPAYREAGLRWGDLAQAQLFDRDPALAWGYFATRLRRARAEPAHPGLELLMRWRARAPGGGFVTTTTVEGRFQRAGLGQDRIVECRGSLEWLQCARECGAPLVPTQDLLPDVREPDGRAVGDFPTCQACGAAARPNVFLLGDPAWDMSRVSRQDERLHAWLARFEPGPSTRVVLLECGETPRLPGMRPYARRLVRDLGARVVRISGVDASVPEGGLALPLSLRSALLGIDERVRAGDSG